MGFWSTLGKIALKVAPIAAAFIPGVGIPLAMAISGATSAASKKIEGGSWGDALTAGAIGAGTGAVGAGALSGIGPTSGALAKLGAGAAGKVGGTGVAGAVGSVLGNIGKTALTNSLSSNGQATPRTPSGASPDTQSQSASIIGRTNPTGTSVGQAVPRGQSSNGVMPRGGFGFADNPMNQTNQNSPNLAQSIFQGRQQAMKDQPFRAGYEVTWPGQIPPGSPANTPTPMTTSYMPRISSDVRYGPGLFSYKNPPQPRGFGRPRQQTTDGAVGG